MKKSILILAYDFPPNQSVGGVRPEAMVEYLSDLGWEVHLISRKWELPLTNEMDVYRATSNSLVEQIDEGEKHYYFIPYSPNKRDGILQKYGHSKHKFQRKFLSLCYQIFDFFILPKLFKKYEKLANKVIKENKINLVLATAEPFILFKVADKVSKKNSLPWIADYRDCWTNERVTKNYTGLNSLLHRFLYRKIELNTVGNASLITTAAPSYQKDLLSIFPNKHIETIYNGFFFDKVLPGDLTKEPSNEFLKIAYVGILYPHQKIEEFLEVLATVSEFLKKTIEITFYGLQFYPEQEKRVLSVASGNYLSVKITQRLPYSSLIGKIKESHLCLLLSDKGMDWLNAKIFDYILAERTVLLYKNDHGVLEEILKDYGLYISAEDDKGLSELLVEIINTPLDNWIKPSKGNQKLKYSRQAQVKRLSDLLISKFKL